VPVVKFADLFALYAVAVRGTLRRVLAALRERVDAMGGSLTSAPASSDPAPADLQPRLVPRTRPQPDASRHTRPYRQRMRTMRQRLSTPTARMMLLLGGAVLVLVTLVTVYWWWQDRSPSPLAIWLAVKAVLWTKAALKIGIAAGVGVALFRHFRTRRRRAATAAVEAASERTETNDTVATRS
jgi:hypothetical protein